MKINTIETPRLFLRSFQKEDACFTISIWNDNEMCADYKYELML